MKDHESGADDDTNDHETDEYLHSGDDNEEIKALLQTKEHQTYGYLDFFS